MPDRTLRELFTEGHKRKFLVIVDESPEGETALYYAARRAQRTGGGLALLFVIEPLEMSLFRSPLSPEISRSKTSKD